jgi:HAD superfamily hydrolase (TIGR01509 family)
MTPRALLFDVDGTLVDSVYQHVAAWCEVLDQTGIVFPAWRIHRRIGLGGERFVEALLADTGRTATPPEVKRLLRRHDRAFARRAHQVKALPGARELLQFLSNAGAPWALVTSGRPQDARPALQALGIRRRGATVVTGDQVADAKPAPDLLVAGAERLGVPIEATIVVGDSVWDFIAARQAGAFGVGLLSGGYGRDELLRAGARRVYQDAADLLRRLGELGIGQTESARSLKAS